jgi:hypothetical protein
MVGNPVVTFALGDDVGVVLFVLFTAGVGAVGVCAQTVVANKKYPNKIHIALYLVVAVMTDR